MERLWKYVLDGTIDYLGTDHAPYLLSDKLPPDGDLRKAACGAPEIDVAIPLILEEGVRNRKMPLQRFAAFTSTNAAFAIITVATNPITPCFLFIIPFPFFSI